MTRAGRRLTLFACPKRLDGAHIETIQRNAITSWTRLPGRPEIILFGDESTARLAAELGTRYSDRIDLTATGAPLLDSLFATAEELANGDLLAYVNADIILMSDFAVAAGRVSAARRSFLMVGQRTDIDLAEPLDFGDGWEKWLRDRSAREGTLQSHRAIDYFVYRAGLWGEIPPLAVGRASFDNWLLRRARETGAMVVDATPVVTAVHQNHDYDHVAGGAAEVYSGPEADRNMELAGGFDKLLFIHDATHVLTRRLLLPALAPRYLGQRWRRLSGSTVELPFRRRVVLWARLRLRRLFGKLA
jgi:hypothetical protein